MRAGVGLAQADWESLIIQMHSNQLEHLIPNVTAIRDAGLSLHYSANWLETEAGAFFFLVGDADITIGLEGDGKILLASSCGAANYLMKPENRESLHIISVTGESCVSYDGADHFQLRITDNPNDFNEMNKNQIMSLVEYVVNAYQCGQTILIHCDDGNNRTAFFFALVYAALNPGETFQAARDITDRDLTGYPFESLFNQLTSQIIAKSMLSNDPMKNFIDPGPDPLGDDMCVTCGIILPGVPMSNRKCYSCYSKSMPNEHVGKCSGCDQFIVLISEGEFKDQCIVCKNKTENLLKQSSGNWEVIADTRELNETLGTKCLMCDNVADGGTPEVPLCSDCVMGSDHENDDDYDPLIESTISCVMCGYLGAEAGTPDVPMCGTCVNAYT